MTFDIVKIVASKEALRRQRIAMPIEEKLRILDQLREMSLAILASRGSRRTREDVEKQSQMEMPDDSDLIASKPQAQFK